MFKGLPSHDSHVGQCVVYQDQDNTSMLWYPSTITSFCADKSCQSVQCEYMYPAKLAMTQSSHMWSVKPTMSQISLMQSVKVIEQSNHKKSQVKPVMAQSTHMWSMSKAARKQIGTQPEIVRNSDKHAALPSHDLNVGQHGMFQDSTSECWYPDVSILCPE